MIRVLHVVGDSQYGGGSAIIERLAVTAKAAGYHVGVLATDPLFVSRLSTLGIEVVSVKCIWRSIRPVRDAVGLLRLALYLWRNRWNIVHTHTSKAGVIGRIAATIAGVPGIIHTTHGFAFHEKSPAYKVFVGAAVERFAAHCCHKVVFVSRFHCDWATRLRIGRSKQRVTIPNGIPPHPQSFGDHHRNENARSNQNRPLTCLTVGRLANEKGIETLISAAALLKSRGRQIQFILAGDGPIRDRVIADIYSKELQGHFNILGFRSDVIQLYRDADIVIQPSIREGLSLVLLEAMRHGKPIIAASIGSNVEVSDHGAAAVLFDAEDEKSLADSIEALADNAERRRQLGQIAFDRFNKYYTEGKMLQGYMSIYKEMCCSED